MTIGILFDILKEKSLKKRSIAIDDNDSPSFVDSEESLCAFEEFEKILKWFWVKMETGFRRYVSRVIKNKKPIKEAALVEKFGREKFDLIRDWLIGWSKEFNFSLEFCDENKSNVNGNDNWSKESEALSVVDDESDLEKLEDVCDVVSEQLSELLSLEGGAKCLTVDKLISIFREMWYEINNEKELKKQLISIWLPDNPSKKSNETQTHIFNKLWKLYNILYSDSDVSIDTVWEPTTNKAIWIRYSRMIINGFRIVMLSDKHIVFAWNHNDYEKWLNSSMKWL